MGNDRLEPMLVGFRNLAILLTTLDLVKDYITGHSLILTKGALSVLKQSIVYVLICYALCLPSFLVHNIYLTCLLWSVWPVLFVKWNNVGPIIGIVYTGHGVAMGLKMVSFSMNSSTSLKSFFYFLVAPTLCYQTEYARTRRIDVGLVISLLTQFILSCHLLAKILTLKISSHIHSVDSLEKFVEYSTWSMVAWIVGFYGYFCCYLTMIAELTMFWDRQFYSDWWNAESVKEFWQKWNIPTHKWFKKHILGKNRRAVIFVVSGVLHGYLVAVPTGRLHLWPVLAIMIQYPLLSASQLLMSIIPSRTLKNFFNWLLLSIFGPLTLLSVVKNYGYHQGI
jgi:diacylglycerol O-acyltransferase-1